MKSFLLLTGLGAFGVFADVYCLFYFLDAGVNYTQSTLISAIIALAGAVVTLFFLYKKSADSHSTKLEVLYQEKEKRITDIYERIIKDTNESRDKLADAHEDLADAIKKLPDEIKRILKSQLMFTVVTTYLNVFLSFATMIFFLICFYKLRRIIDNSSKYDVRYLLTESVEKFNRYTEEKIFWQTTKAVVLFAYHLGRVLAHCPAYPNTVLMILITLYQISSLRVGIIYLKMSR